MTDEKDEVKTYRAELYDEDYKAYTYDRVEVVLKSDYEKLKQEKEDLEKAIIEASDYSKKWGASGLDLFAHGTFRQLAEKLKDIRGKNEK